MAWSGRFRGTSVRRKLFAVYGALWIAGLGVALAVFAGLNGAIEDGHDVRKIDQTLAGANLLTKQLVDMETGVRGFVITGQDEFLEPYLRSRQALAGTFDALLASVVASGQRSRLEQVRSAAAEWDATVLSIAISLRRTDPEAANALVRTGAGKRRLDAIRATLDELTATERDLLAERLRASEGADRLLQLILGIGVLLNLAIGLAGVVFLERSVVRRVSAATRRAEAVRRGDLSEQPHIGEGSDEIDVLLGALDGMRLSLRDLIASKDALRIEADSSNRAKSEFLASMSHELRTPLNAVLGFSDVLNEQLAATFTARQARYLANIRAAGQHLLELINDVLDLSKVEAGKLELRPEPIAIGAVVEPVLASIAQLAIRRKVRFESAALPAVEVLVDPARIRQVLLNLLSNAVKFTPADGDVTFAASIDGRSLRFDVVDTGIGIPDEKRDRLFGLFQRLHEGRSEESGTGLGLAITKRLVELHGGTIDFASRRDEGAHFWVSLPNVVIDAAVGPRVLIVEDETRDGELLVELALAAGLRAEVAPTAASALAAIARSIPTAVVLDLRLPDQRGEAVLRALKADAATATLPVIVVTVEDDDGRARLLGADDHFTKPIDRVRLSGWLRGLMKGDLVASSPR